MSLTRYTRQDGSFAYSIGPLGSRGAAGTKNWFPPQLGGRSQAIVRGGGRGNRSSEAAKAEAQADRVWARQLGNTELGRLLATAVAVDDHGQPIESVPVARVTDPLEAFSYASATDLDGVQRKLPPAEKIREGTWVVKYMTTVNGQTVQQCAQGSTQVEVYQKLFGSPFHIDYVRTLPVFVEPMPAAPESVATPQTSATPLSPATPAKILRPGSREFFENVVPERRGSVDLPSGIPASLEAAYQKFYNEHLVSQVKEQAKIDPGFAAWLQRNMF